MPFKARGRAEEFAVIDRFDGGVGWIAHPEETMQRASHAVVGGSGAEGASEATAADVWVIDPVDADGLDDLLADLGEVRGVVVLVDRHSRDAAAIAQRHDVPVYLPECVDVDFEAAVPVERVSGTLPESQFDVVQTVDWPGWAEAALCDGETLVTGDALGGVEYFTAGSERIGVHPMLRIKPPSSFRQFDPERVLTGHGEGVLEDGATELQRALDGARRNGPAVWFNGLKAVLTS